MGTPSVAAPLAPAAAATQAVDDLALRVDLLFGSQGRLRAPVSPYYLRYSHGMHDLHRGTDLANVRETLGHASLSTTGRYSHSRLEKSSGGYLAV